MITRHFGETQIVTAAPFKSFVSCTLGTAGLTSACGGTLSNALGLCWSGYIIDRLGLSKEFASVLLVPSIQQDPNTSATSCFYYGITLGLQHASSTSGSWQDYSTGEWPIKQSLLAQTTTTATSTAITDLAPSRETLALGPNAYYLSTAGTCTTSTHYAHFVSYSNMAINLAGCKRFVRVLIRPEIEPGGTTCSAAAGMNTMVSLVFGHPTSGPTGLLDTVRGRIIVTSGCSTATGTST